MVSQHLAKFVGHRQCGKGDMFLVVEDDFKDSPCSRLNPSLLFISV